MRINFKEIITCPECLSDQLEYLKNKITCRKCGTNYFLKNNIPHFIETKEVTLPLKKDIKNPINWTAWRKENYYFFEKYLKNAEGNIKILDLGAGQGHFSNLFEKYFYVAVDFYPYPSIDIVCDFSRRLPIKMSFFDCIILSNVLEHIKDPKLLLEECHRVLKSTGMLLITVPFIIKIHQAPYDFNRYTHYMLKYLLDETGFEVVTIDKIGSIVELYRRMRKNFYRFALKPNFVGKIYRRFWKISDIFYDKYLINWNVKKDKERDYFVGYSCIAKKKCV